MPNTDEVKARLGLSSCEEIPASLLDLSTVALPVDDPIKALNNSGAFEILETGDYL
jgi:hypothetical protein